MKSKLVCKFQADLESHGGEYLIAREIDKLSKVVEGE